MIIPFEAASSPSNGTSVKYFLDSNGSFSVELDGPCYVDFEYLVYYETRVSGVVKYGGIDDLKGVKVRRFLIWLDVDAIKVDLPPSQYELVLHFSMSLDSVR
ncbi:hypothetical protein ZIOFF_002356 [Zingiber officinale]|uniref:Uncharacterized protein n=1 Tax=Zingiber officinale TaxID=94328 RepID=A0A8J5LST7_ZINOF|nr:hypothetical protein ZIOFF_002356 [Zingiber officinale]